MRHSVEHNDIDIVACNDPFIEPHYAVSPAEHLFRSMGSFEARGTVIRELR